MYIYGENLTEFSVRPVSFPYQCSLLYACVYIYIYIDVHACKYTYICVARTCPNSRSTFHMPGLCPV